ncbi:MAG: GNAT family N-acetyltransferase [Ginsengibacter sp.]|jgi:ribosomal-protein-alanine N-acetyltransferase
MKKEINITTFIELTTVRLILRQLKTTDDNEIFKLRSDEDINQYLDRPKDSSIADSRQFIIKINKGIKENKSFYWAITLKENPQLIGTICLWNLSEHKKSIELGYELNQKFQGQGIMSEAIKKVIEFAFENIGVTTIEAYTHKDNLKSTSLLLKNNFSIDSVRKDEENINNDIFISTK